LAARLGTKPTQKNRKALHGGLIICSLPTQEGSLRDRARQAIATGDQAAARVLLHQLLVEEPDDGLSASLTDAVVATASADGDVAARERYQRTQRELHDVLGWLDTVRIYAQPDMDALERAAATLERSDASSP
jgi:hypothetical protein